MRWILALLGLGLVVALVWAWLPTKVRSDASATDSTGREAAAELAPASVALEATEPVALNAHAERVAVPVPARAAVPATAPSALVVRVVCPPGESCRTTIVTCEPEQVATNVEPVALEQHADDAGRVVFELDRLRGARCIAIWAVADGRFASQERVFASVHDLPAELVLELAPVARVRFTVHAPDGNLVPGARVSVASRVGHRPLVLEIRTTDADGTTTFRVAPARYDVVAEADWIAGRAESTIQAGDGAHVKLTLISRMAGPPVAVAGVVLDESGRGLANVQVNVAVPAAYDDPSRVTRWRSETVTTNEVGEFELRAAPSGEVQVAVQSDPFVARFVPVSTRVAHGTTDVVLRRERVFPSRKLRIVVVDAVSRERAFQVSLAMKLSDMDGQRIFQGDDGWIDAQISWRDDLSWKVDGLGYRPTEGRLVDWMTTPEGSAVEVALEPDPSEESKSDKLLRGVREQRRREREKDR